ncbi:inhibitor of growth protein 3-like isoform X1 [Phlebotomus papatasi]|uniref:inhibitor of growth protein 3-like isoform X1 n=1 Tax=Phlebotomus papatasi TaxID=29031 RepID=UPI0024836404|nr:inhibitor of growth protein 3-like isoform X1 [Phlebotomus papatasi]
MLYLEDYLEMIEHLPQELRDRFTEMREMDLYVQNNMDSLDKRVRVFFSQCRRNEVQSSQAEAEFQSLRKDYYKVLEDADEKVQLASQMYDLVDRYLRRLDTELYKFKCELEADHNGITEILEKRSLELDGTGNSIGGSGGNHQKENRYFGHLASGSTVSGSGQSQRTDTRYRHKTEKRRDSGSGASLGVEKRQALSITNSQTPVRPVTPNVATSSVSHHQPLTSTPNSSVTYSLHNIGAGNAIAAAASQAIAATQQMQQGRRTASLKASYEAIHSSSGSGAHELLLGTDLAGVTHSALRAVEREGSSYNSSQRRHKKKLNSSLSQNSHSSLPATPTTTQVPLVEPTTPTVMINENGMVVEQTPEGEWTYDPNEPRYCICNQVSYGDMVACDNEDCPFEWFHYPCVGITQSPKGKWYCPQCTSSMRRRGARKT